LNDLLNEEHKLVRDSARAWVKREVSPIIRRICSKGRIPKQIIKVWVKLVVWSLYSEEYGGAGLDQISYGNHARN
jgi:glutaryl-CoA dehydrogenase